MLSWFQTRSPDAGRASGVEGKNSRLTPPPTHPLTHSHTHTLPSAPSSIAWLAEYHHAPGRQPATPDFAREATPRQAAGAPGKTPTCRSHSSRVLAPFQWQANSPDRGASIPEHLSHVSRLFLRAPRFLPLTTSDWPSVAPHPVALPQLARSPPPPCPATPQD